MQFEFVSSCPICGGAVFSDFLTCQDHTTTREQFSLQRCGSCQLLLTNPRPDQESIPVYYESPDYISHSVNSTKLFDKVYLLARSFTLRRKHALIKAYHKGGKILDYGCGSGEFLSFMKGKNWEVQGVEPAVEPRTKANTLVGLEEGHIVEKLEDLKKTKFNVITLWHVLEHVPHPDDLLTKLKHLLAKDGVIFVAAPNSESYDAQFYKQHWAGYDLPRHFWHFSKSTLKKLLANQGLNLIRTEPMKLDAFYVSLLSEKYKNKDRHNLLSPIKAFIRGNLSNAKAKKSMNYSSLIYIARHA